MKVYELKEVPTTFTGPTCSLTSVTCFGCDGGVMVGTGGHGLYLCEDCVEWIKNPPAEEN